MAEGATKAVSRVIDFQTEPARYRHWKLDVKGPVASLIMDVAEDQPLFPGYQLKLNSYDLGVDIELADAVQRLRFEHPQVRVVVIRSGKERVFCSGANIRMLASATHAHKVNFCKFTNETRNAIEDASKSSDQKYICLITGTAAGGGYELALATDHIMLADDGSSAVSLPEMPLLAVLPGTGGLTRVTDKRKVRRDRADFFCSTEEGIKGKRAMDWRLVDEILPRSKVDESVAARVETLLAAAGRPTDLRGIVLTPLKRDFTAAGVRYSAVDLDIDRDRRVATITIKGPDGPPPAAAAGLMAAGAETWSLRAAREIDDAILHLRLNELEIGVLVFKSEGDPAQVLAHDAFLEQHAGHWLASEILQHWKRVFKRIDMTSRSLVTLVEPGSCFAGTLVELVLAADRSYMLIGQFEGDNRPPATLTLNRANFSRYPMGNGLTRLQTRFLGEPASIAAAEDAIGRPLGGKEADALGLVTFARDDIDWDDEVRQFLEARASFSPDCLTGMEANLRFAGPETLETKIFARLTAWQNWIFQRPNAVGPEGALRRYGTGQQATFDMTRV